MRLRRRLALALGAASLLGLVAVGSPLLEDRRIRLHSLVTLDPPPTPAALGVEGLELTVTGALVQRVGPDRLVVLRAWAPTPTVRVSRAGDSGALALRIENLPARVRVDASGPVDEDLAGPTRTLRFSPSATRRIGFTAPDRDVRFAVLGDTGDSVTFSEALRLAALKGADFLLHAGDLIYEDWQIPAIERILATAPLPVFMSRGNHDYRNEARIALMRRLAPPYYAFRMGGATFIVLDNGGDYLPTFWRRSTQYRWWTEVLGEPRTGPLLVTMHKPPFDRRTGPRRAPMLDRGFAQQLMSDFVRTGVDAVFTGHVHESHLWSQDGIPYVVNGEGMSPNGLDQSRMAWVEVRGWQVTIEQVPIWARVTR